MVGETPRSEYLDLEPRNIMATDDGSVVIIDFVQAVICRFLQRCEIHPERLGRAKLPSSPIEQYWPTTRARGFGGRGLPVEWDASSEKQKHPTIIDICL